MELALASAIGVLTAAGVYLLLRARSFDVILGLTLLSYATNLLLFSAGRLAVGKPPVLQEGVEPTLANYADPLPQALVLTAIVIAFAMTAVTIVVAMRGRADNRSDHVDAPLDRPPLPAVRVRTQTDSEADAAAPLVDPDDAPVPGTRAKGVEARR